MSRKRFTQSDIDDACRFYQAGMRPNDIYNRLGMTATTLFRLLRRNGIPAVQRNTRIPSADVVDRYIRGEAETSLAREFRVSPSAIRTRLANAGVHIRTQSEAAFVSARQQTSEQRLARVAAAHDAVRGMTQSEKHRCKIALASALWKSILSTSSEAEE